MQRAKIRSRGERKQQKTANTLFFMPRFCSTQQRSTKLEHITMKQLEELKKKCSSVV